MKTFILHGRLGELMGREWTLEVSSIAEGVRAIECATNRLFEYLLESDKRGIGYKILIGDKNYVTQEQELANQLRDEVSEIHFFPVPVGSGSNDGALFQILAGLVIIVAAIVTYGASVSASGGLSAAWSAGATAVWGAGGAATAFAFLGASMVLGGISQLIAGQPGMMDMGEGSDRRASYGFNGPVNTTRQGGPIPVGYGEMIIGSQVVSLSVRSVRVASDTGTNAIDAFAGTQEGGSGGAGGTGLPTNYLAGGGATRPIDWVKLPEPTPPDNIGSLTPEPDPET